MSGQAQICKGKVNPKDFRSENVIFVKTSAADNFENAAFHGANKGQHIFNFCLTSDA